MRILVTGGTGFVGQEVVRQLHAADHSVRLLTRNPKEAATRLAQASNDVEVHHGDVTDPQSLTHAVRTCDAVIHLVGTISESGARTFERLHVEATRNMIAASQANGVRRFVHMSALGTRSDAVARYHQTKWAAEEAVRKSRLDFSIFRPSIIYGPDDHFVNLFAQMSRWTPVLPVMGQGTALMQPVAVETVGRCFVESLTRPESIGRTFDVCGPEQLTFDQMLDAILEAAGRTRFKLHIPLALARLQATVLEVVVGSMLGKPPPLTRDQLRMLQEDNTGDAGPAEQLFGLKQTRFVEGIRQYVSRVT